MKKKNLATAGAIFCGLILVLSFENCSVPFDAVNNTGNFSSAASGPNLKFSLLSQCVTVGAGAGNLAACLDVNQQLPEGLDQTQIDTCVTNVGSAPFDIANCLWKNGFNVDQYRRPRQIDINACAEAVGNNGIADCLVKRGFGWVGVTQPLISACIANPNVGLANVEKCLRLNNALPKNPIVTQFKVSRCLKLVDQADLADCMDKANILPEGVDQAELDSCIAAVTTASIVRCLRARGHIEAVLQQIHLNECNSAVGEANIAACITANGYDIVGLDQARVDACIAAVTAANIARCLRANDIIDNLLVQEDINLCAKILTEATLVNCLDANGLKPATLEQANVDACILNVTLANVANCLALNGFIPSRLSQLMAVGNVFAASCVTCHSGATPSGDFDMTVYDQLVMRVTPGDAANSVLFQRMNDAAMPMPPAALLDVALRARVESWINDGAKNN